MNHSSASSFSGMIIPLNVFLRNYSSEFWSHFWHFAYGNCYVFNGGTTESRLDTKVLKSSEPGPSYGLSLELNIEQEQYIGALTPEAGVRIHISNQGEMPFPLDKGLSLAPGYATSIGMRKVGTILHLQVSSISSNTEPHRHVNKVIIIIIEVFINNVVLFVFCKVLIERRDPFSENLCVSDSTSDKYNIYQQKMKVNYSTTACKKSCWASNQREFCGCMEYKFPRLEDTPVCNITNKTVAKCLKGVKSKFKAGTLNCSKSCPPPCREITLKLSTSYSLWPTKAYEAFYMAELKKRTKEVDGSDNFRANVLKVDIFFEELNYEVISEEPSYELANFVSDLGGSLGLWIGMSVLSFAELFELLLLICLSVGRKLKNEGNTKSSTIHVEEFKYSS
ncbi:amiloride-sensitive sodium channel subunit alpha-like [Orbicella faveolata]|uniref:amiloride-sensitive sodium channel subunit alpha-like n=1 Tax=Orbicella faveolata TaxID=48498 RepID=UPI0009E339A8|nr:amiloride-sensitive sodium channel subunit alpha-like [Orbicella faveolata]